MNHTRIACMKVQISDYLRGMARADAKTLTHVATFGHWAEMAERERAERAARFLRILDEEQLAAIANGHICPAELARQIAKEQAQKESPR